MNYKELFEYENVQVDSTNLRSLLDRPGDHRRRIVAAIVQLRLSLQAFSHAVEKSNGT